MVENGRDTLISNMRRTLAGLLLATLVLAVACHSPNAQRHYPLTGEIIAVDRAAHQLIIRNDDIPDFMKSMTMPYAVKDPAALDHSQIGQRIKATLVVTRTESWLEDIQVTAQAPADAAAPQSELQIPAEGTPVPDFVFTNQDGKHVHLAQYKGQVVLLTFIYTRCPMPDFCPRMTNNFREIEKSLKQDPAAYGHTHLLSIPSTRSSTRRQYCASMPSRQRQSLPPICFRTGSFYRRSRKTSTRLGISSRSLCGGKTRSAKWSDHALAEHSDHRRQRQALPLVPRQQLDARGIAEGSQERCRERQLASDRKQIHHK